MELGLSGKTVLITGSSKGIGLACAHAFAAEGCNLHLVARDAERLEMARLAITGRHVVEVTTHALDLSASANVNTLAERAGDVDILVNNAGAIPGGPIDVVDEATWRVAWDLKVFGYINMTRTFLARMQARGHGVIVNDIGTGGEKLDYNYIAGAAGNASLMMFTRAMGTVSLRDNIRVVAVNPGLTVTDRMTTMLKGQAKEQYGDPERWRECMPTDPPPSEADDVADLVVFLSSARARMITGTVLTIDGGAAGR